MGLVEFLEARLAEEEATARVMAESIWPQNVTVVPRDDTGDLPEGAPEGNVGVYGLESFKWRRIWADEITDYGFRMHESGIEVWTPERGARLLADVEARRRIIGLHVCSCSPDCGDCGACSGDHHADPTPAPCDTLRHLAAPYSDHPDFDPSWRTQ